MRSPRFTLAALPVALVVLSSSAQPAVGAPPLRAADIRVLRRVVREAKARGFVIRRIQPRDPRMLRHPSHAKTLPRDPAGSNILGNVLSVAKGKLRTWWRPGGANHAGSSLLHELGHGLYAQQRGQFRPRPRRGRLDAHHPMRFVEAAVGELQANNMAIGLLRQVGASKQQIRDFIKSRERSYGTYLHVSKATKRHPEYRAYRSVIRTLRSLRGFTATGSITRDIPEVRRLADALEASDRAP
ncbi:MAG: hypothetical protein KC503_08480 [Myxococcales bacterium]|nr:hypothetical protein [Myxococcales bacterium]